MSAVRPRPASTILPNSASESMSGLLFRAFRDLDGDRRSHQCADASFNELIMCFGGKASSPPEPVQLAPVLKVIAQHSEQHGLAIALRNGSDLPSHLRREADPLECLAHELCGRTVSKHPIGFGPGDQSIELAERICVESLVLFKRPCRGY